jgi:pimeloyl-ACP methyl ester carboxylesterase
MSAIRVLFRALVFFCAVCACAAIAAPDYAREKRWADEITPTLVVGDPVYLAQPGGHKFLALYTGAKKPRAAVIVVHGLGIHPDWGLIGALRSDLPDAGYTTLSVQMPVLAADAKGEDYPALFGDAAERLTVAVAFLKAKGYDRIALVSHSMGSRMSNHFLAAGPAHGIAAWVAIGISSGEFVEAAGFSFPILDIYGERDFPQVLKNADARAATLRKLKGSAQIEVSGSDHYFAGSEAELVRHVQRFLGRQFSAP